MQAVNQSMKYDEAEVETRDEYKGAQEPVSFEWRGRRFRVAQVMDRWYEGRLDSTRFPMMYFRVKTEDGRVVILRYHEFFRAWSIRIAEEVE